MAEKVKDIVLDFSAVEPFLPLDDKRNYLLQVSAMTPGVSKSGGQKIDVEYTVLAPDKVMSVDGDGNAKEVTAKGRKLFRSYSLQPQALPFLHEFLKACGETDEKLGKNFKLDLDNYRGSNVTASIANEEFEEQIRSRVTKVMPETKFAG